MLKNYYLTKNEYIIDLINPEDAYLTNQTKNPIEYTSIRYNSDLYFYKLKFNNIQLNEVLNSLSLKFEIEKDTTRPNLVVDVYYGSGSSIDSDSMEEMYRNIVEYRNYPIKKAIECKEIEYEEDLSENEDEEEKDELIVELQNMNKVLSSDSTLILILRVQNGNYDYNELVYADEPPYIHAQVVDKSSFNSATKFESYEYDNYSKLLVDTSNGNLFNFINLFSTPNKDVPINISVIGNQSKAPLVSYLPYNLMLNYQYEKEEEYQNNELTAYIIKDQYNQKQRFFKVDEEPQTYEDFISNNYGLYNSFFIHEDSETYDRFYNDENGVCMYVDETNIKIYDLNRTCTTFEKTSTGILKLISVVNVDNKGIYYNWENNKVVSISNDSTFTSNDIEISYNSSNYIEEINYLKINLKTTFTYEVNKLSVNYYKNNELLKTNNYLFENNKLVEINNSMNDEKMVLTYLSNKIFELTFYKNNEVISKNTYTYSTIYTKITDQFNESKKVYFDNINRCLYEINNEGNIQYNTYLNSTSKVINQSMFSLNKTLIDNNSFEFMTNNELNGWYVNSHTSTLTIDDGLNGKCLKIKYAGDNNSVNIAQDIIDYTGKLNSFKGFIKHSNASYQNVEIDANIWYTINETEYSTTRSITSLVSTTEWQEFTLPFGISGNISKVKATISFTISGNQECEVCIDELSTNLNDRGKKSNLVINGNFDHFDSSNIPLEWTLSSTSGVSVQTLTDSEHDEYIDEKVLNIGVSDSNKTLKQIIDLEANANESYTLSFIYKLSGSIFDFRPYIIIYNDDEESTTTKYELDVNRLSSLWQVASKTFLLKEKTKKIEVGFIYSGRGTGYIDAVKLFKNKDTSYYSYTEKGSIQEVTDNIGNSIFIIYDDLNRVKTSISKDKAIYTYTYLNETTNKINNIVASNGVSIIYTYDDNGHVETTTLKCNNETITNETLHDDEGYLLNMVDEFGKQTRKTYDCLKNVEYELYPNGLELNSTFTKYNELYTLRDNSITHSYTYEEENRNVQTINVANGNSYKFTYDDYGRLSSVKLNEILLNSFTYKDREGFKTALISTKSYDTNNQNYYTFEYDDYRIKSVKYLNTTITQYEYDSNNNVCKIIDNINSITKNYIYDESGKLKTVLTNKCEDVTYFYDNLGNVKKANHYYASNGVKNRSYEYNYNYENNNFTFGSYVSRLIKDKYNDVIIGGTKFNGINGLKCISLNLNDNSFLTEDSLNIYKFNSNNYAKIQLNTLNVVPRFVSSSSNEEKIDFIENKSFVLWFKPKIQNRQIKLFTFTLGTAEMYKVIVNLEGYVEVYYSNESTPEIVTSNKVSFNGWNMLALKAEKGKQTIYLNGYQFEKTRSNYVSTTLENTDLTINEESSSSGEVFDVLMLSIGHTHGDLNVLYEDGLKAIDVNKNGSFDSTTYSLMSFNNTYEVISLNGSLESNKGRTPLMLKTTKEIFDIDTSLNKYYLASYNKSNNKNIGIDLLGYDLDLKDEGMISLKFKCQTSSNSDVKEIISIYSKLTNNQLLNLYVQNGVIKLNVNGTIKTFSNYVITSNYWHTLTLFYTQEKIEVCVNTTKVGTYTLSNALDLSYAITYLGGTSSTTKLNGLIEKFVIYRDTVSSQENMLNTLAKTNEIKHINKYDNLNRLVAKEIKTDTNTFNQSYTYDKTRVTSFTTFGTTYNYQYDEVGNVINANGSTYTYDKYGRLLTSNYNGKNKYTYDNNGNLSTIERLDSNDNVLSTTVYNRLASNSYKLTSVTGDINATLSYGSGFNPTNITINGVSRDITYEGKRIKTYGNNTYFYNEEGIRVKKVSEDGYTKEYILEGNKILCEKILKLNNESNTYSLIGQLFYHYDLNNELVSVENEGNIYFYVKDLLGVIHKIVDVNGNTVVQYLYDSWGKLINSYTGSVGAFVAQYNPFIYKSYYYDKETKLYYLNSRFYSPELKQFLTIDDINYLDESLGNMNLFSYCNNNPVMYYDPSGHAVEWSQILSWVTAGILAVSIVVLSIYTAGAILAAAPALASYLSTAAIAYTGIVGLGSSVATAVSIGAGVLSVGTITIGINEGISFISGRNFGAELLGEEVYNCLSMTIGMLGGSYIIAGSMLPYPYTGTYDSFTSDEQKIINDVKNNPSLGYGKFSMKDPRMPGWLGWTKYEYRSESGIYVHYVGNRYLSKFYPFSPWFDFKIKWRK